MFDNNVNVMLDKSTILLILGFFMSIMSCFMLKKGIEHSIMNLSRKPLVQGLLLILVALGLLSTGLWVTLSSESIVDRLQNTAQKCFVVEKQKK